MMTLRAFPLASWVLLSLNVIATAAVAAFMTQCTSETTSSRYDLLSQYNGKYEYSNPKSLILATSDFDTTLYAILNDGARYRLKFISKDTFQDGQKNPIIFQRDTEGNVISYTTDGQVFKILSKEIDTLDWFPNKSFFGNANEYKLNMPSEKKDGLKVGDLQTSFTHPELIEEMVRKTVAGEFPDVHSILIWKNGKLVLEEYFYGHTADTPHALRSASKSFIGTLVGIAVDQGKISSENALLLPFFSNTYPQILNLDQRKKEITIKDFLTYKHGMDCDDEDGNSVGNELKMYEHEDWIKFTLDLPMIEDPGKRSSYCTGCAHTIGRLVEIATDTPIEEFGAAHLFKPLGITNYQWEFSPDSGGVTHFNQMYLRPRDMLKLGLLYYDTGKWQGRQIVSADWVNRTFAKEDPEFGYLWRHRYFEVDGKRYNSFLATGNGGQKINIWPELKMITVFTGGSYNSYLLYGKPSPPNDLIADFILKAL